MFKQLLQAGAAAALLAGSVSAQAVLLCNATAQGSKLTICYAENPSAGGQVTGTPVDARGEFNAFLKQNTIGVDSFVGQSPGNPISTPEESPIGVDFGNGITGSVTGSYEIFDPLTGESAGFRSSVYVLGNNNPESSEGRFGTSGDGDAERFIQGNNTFVIEFSQLVSAFGFYATDVGDFGGLLTLELLDANGTRVGDAIEIVTSTPTGETESAGGGNLLFWGFVDTANQYKSVRVNFNIDADGMGFDDFVTGTLADGPPNPTPQPASLALLGAALAAAGLSRRRARRTS